MIIMRRRRAGGSVRAKRNNAIEFTIHYRGQRFRPTVPTAPTEANLRRARERLEGIQKRIEQGTFNLLEEFPDYRYQEKYADVLPRHRANSVAMRSSTAF